MDSQSRRARNAWSDLKLHTFFALQVVGRSHQTLPDGWPSILVSRCVVREQRCFVVRQQIKVWEVMLGSACEGLAVASERAGQMK